MGNLGKMSINNGWRRLAKGRANVRRIYYVFMRAESRGQNGILAVLRRQGRRRLSAPRWRPPHFLPLPSIQLLLPRFDPKFPRDLRHPPRVDETESSRGFITK